MKQNEHQDRLVDLLLSELIGKETPPDVRARVLSLAEELPTVAVQKNPFPRVVSFPSAKRSIFPALAIAAAVTLLGVAGVFFQLRSISSDRTPVLTSVSGMVDRSLGLVPNGGSLTTGAESTAVLTFDDGTVVELLPETTIVMTHRSRWDRSKGIEIISGGVKAEVAPQRKGSPMVLTSKDARAEVVGTKFSFDLNDMRSRLEVTEGKVRFVPVAGGDSVLVETGYFAENGKTGFRHAAIFVPPVLGITRFTLMNAETDRPIREEALVSGETISLSSLPTDKINIRADYEGKAPISVKISLTLKDGSPTGLRADTTDDQQYPPFFVAGDFWADGRPNDCQAWTPIPGIYRLSAEAFYGKEGKEKPSKPLVIRFQFTK